jgi:hypothetical protein
MKKIIINTLSVVALTIGASQAKAQLASDSPSPALKLAAPVAAARPAAELQTASATIAVSESKKSPVSAAAQPSQGGVQEPASVNKAAVAVPNLPLQEGQQPKQEEIKPAAKVAVPSQGAIKAVE